MRQIRHGNLHECEVAKEAIQIVTRSRQPSQPGSENGEGYEWGSEDITAASSGSCPWLAEDAHVECQCQRRCLAL